MRRNSDLLVLSSPVMSSGLRIWANRWQQMKSRPDNLYDDLPASMEDRNNLFPVFLKLEELDTLIVGGGNVGLEKLNAILKSSPRARITVVASAIKEEIRQLAQASRYIRLVERDFRVRDLQSKDVVVLATDDPVLHARIRTLARKRRLLVNVADTPDLCDFYLGSIVTKGNLKIGISTNGKSP